MELGRFLVREYLGERSNDTLSRWLLHAIAERIAKADQSKKDAEHSRFEKEAAELILQFWAHRAVGPKGVDPLTKYDRVLKAFRSLLPGASPWESHEAERNDRIAVELYENMTMLTLSLLLVGLDPSPKRSVEAKALHNRFLPASQAAILLQFEQIENLFSLSGRSAQSSVNNGESESEILDVADAVRSWAKRTGELSQEVLKMFESVSIPRLPFDSGNAVRTASKLSPKTPLREKLKSGESRLAGKKAAKKSVGKKSGTAKPKPKSRPK